MIEAPLALAFSAGLVATVNPCGFAMLPAYLSYFMGLDDGADVSAARGIRSALTVGGIVSLGFLIVFGATGILITAGARFVIDWIPWFALVIGGAVVVLGVAMLRGFELTVGLPKAKRAGKGRGYGAVFGFGVSYAIASLSCTLPVFLTVVATQVTRGTFVSGVATFLAYGIGMALVLVGLTVALALGKRTLVARIRGASKYVNRVAGVILVIAGAYIVWFWGTNLTSGAGALGSSGVFQFVETLSRGAFTVVGNHAVLWGIALAAVIGIGVGIMAWSGRNGGEDVEEETVTAGHVD